MMFRNGPKLEAIYEKGVIEEHYQKSREKKKGDKKMDDKCLCCGENVAKGKQVCEKCDVVDYEAWENYKLNNPSKVELHSKICNTLNDMYQKKNHDYGDSFAKLRVEIPDAILVRIYDKYSRLKTLMDGTEQKVKDESINDTLMDLANYCIMELIERDGEKNMYKIVIENPEGKVYELEYNTYQEAIELLKNNNFKQDKRSWVNGIRIARIYRVTEEDELLEEEAYADYHLTRKSKNGGVIYDN